MKKYVFITFAVPGIGGTQIYVRNKLLYLQRKGWDVSVISTEPGDDIFVKELRPYANSIMPELMDNPYLYSSKKREKILEKMVGYIGEWDKDTVIETNFFQVTLWGELLAKKLGIRHFVFLIQEEYRNLPKSYLEYYSFKYDRGELAVNTRYALPQLFSGFREIKDSEQGFLSAECSNTIEDCESEYDEAVTDADYHIASIGRVNKPFVNKMAEDVASFAREHSDKSFRLVFFGGSPYQEDHKKIYEIANKADNLSVYITGPIFPIPKSLLDNMDVFVSSAGAATTSHNAGYLTIAIDANDFDPIGILGYTTNETIHRGVSENVKTTQELLNEILIQNKYSHSHSSVCLTDKDMDNVFDKHMAYLSQCVADMNYYDMSRFMPKGSIRLGYRLLGKKNFLKLYSFVKGAKDEQ